MSQSILDRNGAFANKMVRFLRERGKLTDAAVVALVDTRYAECVTCEGWNGTGCRAWKCMKNPAHRTEFYAVMADRDKQCPVFGDRKWKR